MFLLPLTAKDFGEGLLVMMPANVQATIRNYLDVSVIRGRLLKLPLPPLSHENPNHPLGKTRITLQNIWDALAENRAAASAVADAPQ